MMRHIWIVCVWFTVSCGQDLPDRLERPEWDGTHDIAMGLMLIKVPDKADPVELANFAQQRLEQTRDCTNIYEPLFVYLIVEFTYEDLSGYDGYAWWGGNHYDYIKIYYPKRKNIMNHEFIHYLLYLDGFPSDSNRDHESDLFVTCATSLLKP